MANIKVKRLCMIHGLYEGDRCLQCKGYDDKQYNKLRRNNDLATVYNRKAWKVVRMRALIESNFMCVHCKRDGVDELAVEVDHIIPLEHDITLAYELSNLQPLCKHHHSKKTAEDVIKYGG
jgi:5-methylcytosine-specific restriction endonuclease McrA